MTPPTVYVLQEITVTAGKGQAFLDAYMKGFAPGARDRGMVLERTLVNPPLWLDDRASTIVFTWAVQGVPGVWKMIASGRGTPAVEGFWDEVAPMVQHRAQRLFVEPADMEALSHV
jgi:hypothetical protein